VGKTKVTIQIIAGDYKGKKLELPDLEVTRSSKSIIRESFFNRLQFDIIDVPFVEFFGGSGSIGLEAVSRGAKKSYFFEKDERSFATLQRNIKTINASRCEAVKGDVFTNFPQLLSRLKKAKEAVYFYADPPFSIRDGMDDIYDKTIQMIASIPSEIIALVAIEHMTGLELPETIGDLHCVKSKKFGKTTLSYYEK
jgi:16S rRNA (guanine(966)-N(2))-methyltransferase RsmD